MAGLMTSEAKRFYDLAWNILDDACPPDDRMYLCRYVDSFSDDLCYRCWSNHLLSTIQGNQGVLYTDREQGIAERMCTR